MNLTHNAGSINVDDVRRGEGHGVLVNGHRVTAGLPTSLDAWDVVPIGGAANFLFWWLEFLEGAPRDKTTWRILVRARTPSKACHSGECARPMVKP